MFHRHHSRLHAGRRFAKRLYFRIWLAVLASLLIAGMLAGAAWKWHGAEWPRDIVLTDAQGNRAGTARIEYDAKPGGVRVELNDGKVLFARWQRDSNTDEKKRWSIAPPIGFAGWLLLIALAVGVGAYPVVRRLTRRLEQLQVGVDALGAGDLAARVPVRGHDEIAWLAERFNHAAAQIETLVQSHKTLLANASHELRSPLARIRMAIEMLGDNGAAPARVEIARNITELDQLIEEILLASRLDARAAPAEPFEQVDLTALAAEECARSGAQLEAEGVVTLSGSGRLLRRLTRNLIENALRYGAPGIAPEVSLKRQGDTIELAVCDAGPGVPEAERERIFEPFYRVKGASEAQGSNGLGLALVRAIAREHQGSVRCEARPGGGACFRVTLPALRG